MTQVSVADDVIALPAGPNFGRRGLSAYQQAFASPAERRRAVEDACHQPFGNIAWTATEAWTDDPILRQFRFTNCYRAADRVSQYLLTRVAYAGPQDERNLVFRTLLFKMFNKISTSQLLEEALGEISWETYDVAAYDEILSTAFGQGRRLYSAAYVMPPPALGASRKHGCACVVSGRRRAEADRVERRSLARQHRSPQITIVPAQVVIRR